MIATSGSMPGPGSYAHSGSDAITAPVAAKAREREPPRISRNPQRSHVPKSAHRIPIVGDRRPDVSRQTGDVIPNG